MAIVGDVSDFTVVVIVVVLAALVWMIKLAMDMKNAIITRSKSLDSKISNLEGKAVSIRREVLDLHKVVHSKLDREDFEKRIDGLIELVGKKEKETSKKKDAR